jgi:hypothetical protein
MPFQALTAAKLAQAEVGTTLSTIYITPQNTQTYVKDICICNTAASKVHINLYLVSKGQAAGAGAPSSIYANALYYNLEIDSHTTTHWTGVQILNEGDTIQVSAGAVGLIVTISGAQAV